MTVLAGKCALVTGAASGLGLASAQALVEAGASVLINDVDEDGLMAAYDALSPLGEITRFVGDVSSVTAVAAMFSHAQERLGGVDIVHANAGVERYETLECMKEPDLDRLLDVDLKGVLLCMQAAIPYLRRRGGGSIIITSSVQATHSLPGCVVYAAAKAGVVAAARTLALEVGPENIRVNAISPGTIDTPMLRRDLADMDLHGQEDFLKRVREANTLRRIGAPSEIGQAVVWLASDQSSYITATNLVIDGGFTAVKTF